jgi:outer membrane lipoprotein SlyB
MEGRLQCWVARGSICTAVTGKRHSNAVGGAVGSAVGGAVGSVAGSAVGRLHAQQRGTYEGLQ